MATNEPHPSTAVSVIGLGQMGTRLATAFLAAGHATTVWNRTPRKVDALVAEGAVRAQSVADAVTASGLVVVCLPDYETVNSLLAPVAADLRGRALVNLTSGTPQAALEMATWADEQGVTYLDGAAMSGTRLVGQPEALFIFSGSTLAFTTHEAVLASLGNATFLGGNPGLTSLYDTALFGLAWSTLAGFYHAIAMLGADSADVSTFTDVAIGHMPFVTGLMADHVRQIGRGEYPDDDGTVSIHAAAMAHLIHESKVRNVTPDVPELAQRLLARAQAAGYGDAGIASVFETMREASLDVRTPSPHGDDPRPRADGDGDP